jgi:hypothetical protein
MICTFMSTVCIREVMETHMEFKQPNIKTFFLCGAKPKSGLGRLVFKVSRSHTQLDTQTVELLWTSDQPVAEADT